jgi:uncharacterized membrane protein YdbT with pleckstrin-like domain
MSDYINSVLIPDEEVIYVAHLSQWGFLGYYVVGVLLTPLFGLGLFIILWAYLVNRAGVMGITNKRIISKRGILFRNTIELLIGKVESIQIQQSLMGRFLNYGTVVVTGTGVSHEGFQNVADPMTFRKHFMIALDKK